MSYAVAEPTGRMNHASPALQERLSSSWMLYTPEMAADILDNNRFDRQRRVRRDHVIFLTRLMNAGDFQPSEIKFAVTPDRRRYLINGQHRLLAIIASGKPQMLLCTLVQANSMDHVAVLYTAEDRGLSRTISDTYGAMDIVARIGVPDHFVRRAGGAMQLLDVGFASRPANYRLLDSTRVRMLEFYAEELRIWAELVGIGLSGPKRKLGSLNRAPVIAVAVVTIRHQRDSAKAFWKAAADNDGLRKGQPVRTLVDLVQFNRISSGSLGYMHAKAVARCWNAYYEGRELAFARPGNASDPILILGTPYDGKRVVPSEALAV